MDKIVKATGKRSLPCQVCQAGQFKAWRWHGLEACESCGHVRKSSMIDRTKIDDFMSKYFDVDFAVQNDVFTRFYENLNSRRRLRELQGLIAKGGRVLEVGVGRGNLLVALRSAGYQVQGIDLSREVCSAVQTRYGLSVHCSTLEEYAGMTPPSTCDAVIMCHVLEHIESLLSTLNAARNLLRQGGVLYIAVPNLSAWNAYWPGWTGYEPYHVHYFHPESLRRVLQSVNFDVLYERTFEPISGWFNTIIRSFRHRSPDLNPPVPGQHRNRPGNGFLWYLYNVTRMTTGCLLSPLRWLQSAAGYGEELVMIAQYGFPR